MLGRRGAGGSIRIFGTNAPKTVGSKAKHVGNDCRGNGIGGSQSPLELARGRAGFCYQLHFPGYRELMAMQRVYSTCGRQTLTFAVEADGTGLDVGSRCSGKQLVAIVSSV